MGYTKINEGEKKLISCLLEFDKLLLNNNLVLFNIIEDDYFIELLSLTKEIDSKTYVIRFLLNRCSNSCYAGRLTIKGPNGDELFITFKEKKLESNKFTCKFLFDYRIGDGYIRKVYAENWSYRNRSKFYFNEFFNAIHELEASNKYDMKYESCEFGEKYFLADDGNIHCHIDHFDCYLGEWYKTFNFMKIINLHNGNKFEFYYDKNSWYRSPGVSANLEKNNSNLTMNEFSKIEDNIKKLQLELPIFEFFTNEVLSEIADDIDKLIDDCDALTLRQELEEGILEYELRHYSNQQLKKVLQRRKTRK